MFFNSWCCQFYHMMAADIHSSSVTGQFVFLLSEPQMMSYAQIWSCGHERKHYLMSWWHQLNLEVDLFMCLCVKCHVPDQGTDVSSLLSMNVSHCLWATFLGCRVTVVRTTTIMLGRFALNCCFHSVSAVRLNHSLLCWGHLERIEGLKLLKSTS